jgi:hypothetical protein
MDYKEKWLKLKEQIEEAALKLEAKEQSVHRDWAPEYRHRAYELRCVIKTMESIEKEG